MTLADDAKAHAQAHWKKYCSGLVVLAIVVVLILQFVTHTISLLERKSGAKEEEREERTTPYARA